MRLIKGIRKVKPGVYGFTLIEVLAAIVVLSFGVVVVLRALETSLSAMGSSRDTMWGNILVREILAGTELDMRSGMEISSYSSGQAQIGPYRDFMWEREMEPASVFVLESEETKVSLYKVDVGVWRAGSPGRRYSAETFLRRIE